MEENNQGNVNAEDIKKEAKETVNQVKDSFKNVNMKKETEKAKSYFSRMLKEPVTVIGEIAHDESNSFFKTALVLLVVWIVISLVTAIIGLVVSIVRTIFGIGFEYILQNLLGNIWNIITSVIAPIISVVLLTGVIFLMNKKSKKSFLATFATVMAAKIPVVISVIIGLISFIPYIGRITSPISGVLSIISTVLAYFAIKELNDEATYDGALKKFIIIEGIFYLVQFVLSFMRIYI